jgi:DNA-binding IclR family transcriptional regulator
MQVPRVRSCGRGKLEDEAPVPIIDRNDHVRGGLTIYGPTTSIHDDLFYGAYPDLLMRSSNIVEILMNYD